MMMMMMIYKLCLPLPDEASRLFLSSVLQAMFFAAHFNHFLSATNILKQMKAAHSRFLDSRSS